MSKKTEDQVRTEAAEKLGFNDSEENVIQGVGQLTTFKKLGFSGDGKTYKPDGWYLPTKESDVAIILEVKSEDKDLQNKEWVSEITRNVMVAQQKYAHVIGILYNGSDIRIWKNDEEIKSGISSKLENKKYYTRLFSQDSIDKQQIYNITKRINDSLHSDFKMTDLTDRMIFTACALVAQRYNPVNGLATQKNQGYDIMRGWVEAKLADAVKNAHNEALDILIEEYKKITPSVKDNTAALDKIIDNICEIAKLVNSEYWNGEDVMAIFFNEFNRYRKKKELGQILTPDHVTSFMYRLIGVNKNDRVLDATCGTGAFLVKAMCNMMKEAGGYFSDKSKDIRTEQLFGIEMERRVFALACANMLIHKDGKTNLVKLDSREEKAVDWIREKQITKVLMNPPYENKYGCMKIVENVLNAVPIGTLCAFILPDKKLEKGQGWKLLKSHTLKTIVKMPEELFFGVGITTSVFVFEAGIPQNDKDIIGYYIEDDGLETVKNKGRQDVKHRWPQKEDYWIKAIQNGNDSTKQIIHPRKDRLSYQMPEKPLEIYEEDFIKTMMDYEEFNRSIDAKEFNDCVLRNVLYSSRIEFGSGKVNILLEDINIKIDTHKWESFRVGDLFDIHPTKAYKLTNIDLFNDGDTPVVVNSSYNNGIGGKTTFKPTERGNMITFSDTVDANTIFYQGNDFVGYPHIQGLYPKGDFKEKWTRNSLLFFAVVFRKSALTRGFDFGNKFRRDIALKLSVLLPISAPGIPDFSAMEKDILAREQAAMSKIDLLQKILNNITESTRVSE